MADITRSVRGRKHPRNPGQLDLVEHGFFPYNIDYLLIAGGGSGGPNIVNGGGSGGGGAGELYYKVSQPIIEGTTYNFIIGAGGINDVGGDSSAFGVTMKGGGYGGKWSGWPGGNGGSGGGGGGPSPYDSAGVSIKTIGLGNDGGIGTDVSPWRGGGGGGSGGVGSTGASNGNGGSSTSNSITGSSIQYAGGGGGGVYSTTAPGSGGGGGAGNGGNNGNSGQNASPNTGSGGGGGGTNATTAGSYGTGGSGVLILRIPTEKYSGVVTGSPVITIDGAFTIVKFTTNGSYTA